MRNQQPQPATQRAEQELHLPIAQQVRIGGIAHQLPEPKARQRDGPYQQRLDLSLIHI